MINVLIVEDTKSTRRLLSAVLKAKGYTVFAAEDGVLALELMDKEHVDLMIVDVMMPNMDGNELTRQLRSSNFNLPILMLTAKQLLEDKRDSFKCGADDYLTKPFDDEELILRVEALLRRCKIVNENQLTVGEVTLKYDELSVSKDDETVVLPPKEFYLLYKLLSYPNKIFTRIELMDEIWGMETDSADNTVNVHINRLRGKFENYKEFELVTVRGLGYKAVRHD